MRILHPYADAYASVAFAGTAGYLVMRHLAPSLQAARIAATVVGVTAARREAEDKVRPPCIRLACRLPGTPTLPVCVSFAQGWRLPWWALDGSQRVVGGDKDPRREAVEKKEKEKEKENKWW